MKQIIMLALVLLVAMGVQAQKYQVNAAGKVEQVQKDSVVKAKTPDPVVAVIGGDTFYRGAKGGVYYWKTSANTGKKYKVYVKQKK